MEQILVVEDDEGAREALKLLLEGEGYGVSAAAAVAPALAALRGARCDLLVTDFHLPDGTGGDLIAAAREAGILPRGGALVVTARPEAVELPDVRVLAKPVDFDRLLREIESALKGVRVSVSEAPAAAPRVELVLYVTAGSIASIRAARNLHRVLADYDATDVAVRVVDVEQHPDLAAEDRVDFTPAVVRRAPAPRWRLLGDLRNRKPLDDLLLATGLERR